MEFLETESTLTIKEAPMDFLKFLKAFPYKLIYWEGVAEDDLVAVSFGPNNEVNVQDLIDASISYAQDEDEDKIKAHYNLYFLKRDDDVIL